MTDKPTGRFVPLGAEEQVPALLRAGYAGPDPGCDPAILADTEWEPVDGHHW